jgi:hypothetical protein
MDQFLDLNSNHNSMELSGHIASMHDATSLVSIENPYVFFDIPYTPEEIFSLEQFHAPAEFNRVINYNELPQLREQTGNFIKNLDESNSVIADILSNLIVKLVDSALQVRNKESSIVILATNNRQGWHIDFCMDEIENLKKFSLFELPSLNKDIYYGVALNGSATLFYPSEEAARQEIQEVTNANSAENTISSSIFNISKIEAPNNNQGAAFLCGTDHGAIHTSPLLSSDRLVVIISPGDKTPINIYKEFVLNEKKYKEL